MKIINPFLAVFLFAAVPVNAQFRGDKPDYTNPRLYLEQGPQSELSTAAVKEIQGGLDLEPGAGDLATISALRFWLLDNFESTNLGEATAGQTTAAGLLAGRKLGGCHDWGLLFAAALRGLGYPAIMVDAASLRWARAYKTDSEAYGHVFVEVYARDKWLLVDPVTGRVILDYDPEEPVIPLYLDRENKAFYAVLKGTDPESYGIAKTGALKTRLREFAANLSAIKLSYPRYNIAALARTSPPIPRVSEEELAAPCAAQACAGTGKKGLVLQTSGFDLYLERLGGAYKIHVFPYGGVFGETELSNLSFSTLKELNARIKFLAVGR